MKKLWLLLISVLMLTACSEDKISGDGVDLTNEFEITDNPNDPVQHERYQIFKEYNVPVLFNDTIADWYRPVWQTRYAIRNSRP